MAYKRKVLIIDRDVLARRAIANILNDLSAFEVRVSGSLEEIDKIIEATNPDVVLIDVEQLIPDKNSLFISLRMQYPGVSFVVLSSRTEEGADAALFALRNGAIDFVTKPEHNRQLLFANDHLMKRLPGIVEVAARGVEKQIGDKPLPDSTEQTYPGDNGSKQWSASPFQVVVIGSCTGGPKALNAIFKELPANLSVPLVVVQHFPKIYTRKLAQSLSKTSNVTVREAYDGADLFPGRVWLTPGGYHTEVQYRGATAFLKVHQGPREHEVRPSINVLFRSAGRVYGPGTLGIILSGHGEDGIAGAREILRAGGQVIVQDPRDAVVGDLPISLIRSGLATRIGSAELIGREIAREIPVSSTGFNRSPERASGSEIYQKSDRAGV